MKLNTYNSVAYKRHIAAQKEINLSLPHAVKLKIMDSTTCTECGASRACVMYNQGTGKLFLHLSRIIKYYAKDHLNAGLYASYLSNRKKEQQAIVKRLAEQERSEKRTETVADVLKRVKSMAVTEREKMLVAILVNELADAVENFDDLFQRVNFLNEVYEWGLSDEEKQSKTSGV